MSNLRIPLNGLLVFILFSTTFSQVVYNQHIEAPLPILPAYDTSKTSMQSKSHESIIDVFVRLLIRLDRPEAPTLPEGTLILRRYSLIPYLAVKAPLNKLNEIKKSFPNVYPDRVFELNVLKQPYISRPLSTNIEYSYLGSFPTLLNETTKLTRAEEVWAEGYRGRGVIIAIVDTGIDKAHPDLDDLDDEPLTDDPKVLAEVAFISDGSNDTRDIIGHGTHVASIAAGTGASGGRGFKATFAAKGVLNATILPYTQRGVAPEAYLYNVKVFNDSSQAYESDIIAGIEWAVEHGADVINLSLGGEPVAPASEDPLVKAVEEAVKNNVVVTIAAGNSGPALYTVLTPGVAPSAIAVGAAYETKEVTYFSSRGPTPFEIGCKPDVLAFGAAVLGANAFYSENDEPAYVELWGTSIAAPQAAGAAALLIQAFPGITAVGVKAAIMEGAYDLSLDPMVQGAGLLDVKGAFEAARRAAESSFRSPSLTGAKTSPAGVRIGRAHV